MKKIIHVAKPDMPPLEEFIPYLEMIWQERWLTNDGNFLKQFEAELESYLGVQNLSVVSNGTLALLLAIQALELKGEVITTPYSFVATPHALLWNNMKPVFADVCADNFALDVDAVERAITADTCAILAVHCYGYPCDTGRLKALADRYGIKLIYDAAHAFGERAQGQSLLAAGDVSVLSFHATKVFHTFEGGAIICRSPELKRRVNLLRNFGIAGELEVIDKGINAKMNEMQAAYGLLQLKYVDAAIDRRSRTDAQYRQAFSGMAGIRVPAPEQLERYNYSYFPVLVERNRDLVYQSLKDQDIYCRRYFFPLLSNLPMYSELPSAVLRNLPVANRIAGQILCLPMHAELSGEDTARVISVFSESVEKFCQ